ncbi:MAG: chorismate-binding protein, partial [Myxococcota bacterium]
MLNPPFDLPCDLVTPVSAFRKLAPLGARYLLESVENGPSMQLGRYSFLGFGDARFVRLEGDTYIDGEHRIPAPKGRAPFLAALRESLDRAYRPVTHPEANLPFIGGLVGVAGFDVLRRFDRVRPPAASKGPPHPELAYVSTRSLLVFDHLTRRAALLHDGSDAERAALRKEVQALLDGRLPPLNPSHGLGDLIPSFQRDAFLAAVAKGQDHIQAGDLFQLVLSVRMTAESDLEPFEVYRALRILNPSPYMSFIDLGDVQIVGSSPEALVKMDGDLASLRPIAGTRPRGADEAA